MDRERPRRLFWQVMIPLAVTFALLWLGTMFLLTVRTCEILEGDVSLAVRTAREALEEQWDRYQVNQKRLGAEAASILRENLGTAALGLSDVDGGMAFLVRDGDGTEIRSPLAYGYGHVDGVDQGTRWYLELDSGLDDAGQIALAEWIMAHRDGWAYTVYPPDAPYMEEPSDGTYARVTGWEEAGNTIRVQKIELIHPDGSAELVVETHGEGEDPIAVNLAHLNLESVLLPAWWSNGERSRNGYTNTARRLANFREAQARLEQYMEGHGDRGNPGGGGGSMSGSGSGGGTTGSWAGDGVTCRYLAYVYDVRPAALRQNLPLYVSTLILTVLVLLGLSRHLARRVTGPVEELSGRAERDVPCLEDGPIRELNALAAAVNAGRGRLEAQLRRERDFTRAAAHELKTPLAVLRAHAEALREDIAPDKREAYLAVVLDESDRMAALVGDLLDLSRLEAGADLRVEPVELSALVRGAFDRLALPMERRGLRLELDLAEGTVAGDRARLEQAVDNLAANALRYTPEGGAVRAALERRGDALWLTVDNDGPNLSAGELARLWEPFYRGDPSRSRATGGAGLGLAIVRAAVEAHGGRCWAENRRGGVRFRIALPALQSD